MNREKRFVGTRLLVLLVLIVVGLLIAISPFPHLAFAYADAALRGPKVVLSAPSPDGDYEAYVEDLPSIDPPNQALFVEHSDKVRFMHIADLAEDVDAIIRIVWSPDSNIVVFHSRDYLTATRISDWRTIRIYLGKEWTRSQPFRGATFACGGPQRTVEAIEFPADGRFAYRLDGNEQSSTVRMDSLVQP